jgi:hypothetical protein
MVSALKDLLPLISRWVSLAVIEPTVEQLAKKTVEGVVTKATITTC